LEAVDDFDNLVTHVRNTKTVTLQHHYRYSATWIPSRCNTKPLLFAGWGRQRAGAGTIHAHSR
jgi:hypothetical protein